LTAWDRQRASLEQQLAREQRAIELELCESSLAQGRADPSK
jgi:hypothetical protein